jgi:hypothetical protein
MVVAAIVAQQSYASLAVQHGLPAAECCAKLVAYLRSLGWSWQRTPALQETLQPGSSRMARPGVDHVYDASLGRSLALLQAYERAALAGASRLSRLGPHALAPPLGLQAAGVCQPQMRGGPLPNPGVGQSWVDLLCREEPWQLHLALHQVCFTLRLPNASSLGIPPPNQTHTITFTWRHSTVKSPQQIMGALLKRLLAEKHHCPYVMVPSIQATGRGGKGGVQG